MAIEFWKIAATMSASDSGHYALRTSAFYDLYLNQRLVLQPHFETNWYTAGYRGRAIGHRERPAARSDIMRKISQYVRVSYQRCFGGTKSLRRATHDKIEDVRFLISLRSWF